MDDKFGHGSRNGARSSTSYIQRIQVHLGIPDLIGAGGMSGKEIIRGDKNSVKHIESY